MRHGCCRATLHVDAAVPARRLVGGRGRAADRGAGRGRRDGRPRRAGVSSFGISGTNAHVVLEEAPPLQPAPVGRGRTERMAPGLRPLPYPLLLPPPYPPLTVLPWSSPAAPRRAARAGTASELSISRDELDLADVALALAGRRCFEHRAVVLGGSDEELLAGSPISREERVAGRCAGSRGRRGDGVPVHRPGRPAARHGPRSVQGIPGVPGGLRRGLRELDDHLGRSTRALVFGEEGPPARRWVGRRSGGRARVLVETRLTAPSSRSPRCSPSRWRCSGWSRRGACGPTS